MHSDFEYEKFRIERIERDKKEHEPFSEIPDASPKRFLIAMVFLLKNFLSSIPVSLHSYRFLTLSDLLEHVTSFRDLLVLLSQKDLSQNLNFVQDLSNAWSHLTEDAHLLKINTEIDRIPLMKLNFFLNTLSHFPPGEEHSLGFYLNSFAGKEWIPFPFLNLLKKLYEEHALNAKHATLTQWISLLNALLSSH